MTATLVEPDVDMSELNDTPKMCCVTLSRGMDLVGPCPHVATHECIVSCAGGHERARLYCSVCLQATCNNTIGCMLCRPKYELVFVVVAREL